MSIQKLSIEWPFGEDLPSVYCPSCGTKVLDGLSEVPQPACPHIHFLYFHEVGEFDYVHPKLQKWLEDTEDQVDEDEYFTQVEVLEQRWEDSKEFFIYELTTGGMAMAPYGPPLASASMWPRILRGRNKRWNATK